MFLLENVRMLSKWEDVINRTLGVKGAHINSALVSAQIRKRIYWTNIAEIPQPEDKGIFLRDILQSSVPEKYYINGLTIKQGASISEIKESLNKVFPRVRGVSITGNGIRPHRGDEKKSGLGELKTILFESSEKTGTLLTSASSVPALIIKRRLRRITPTEAARLQTVPDWYKWECSDTQRYKMLGNGWTVAVIYHIFSFIK